MQALLGMVTEVDAKYNFQRDGSPLPEGAPLKRRYGINGYEFYGQDSWKIKPTFTLTLGLRWSLFSPPWETNKLQVQPTFNLDNWFLNRAQAGLNRSEEHTSELQSLRHLVCRLLLEKKKNKKIKCR